MKFTILGAGGFIGKNLVKHLKNKGFQVDTPSRDVQDLKGKNLGHVIYAIGLTGNFRERPYDAVEAHVYALQRLIEGAQFDSWLYLSSTRVYQNAFSTDEDASVPIKPGLDGLYDASKVLGECICLANTNSSARVARLSNVYGAGQSKHTFLGSILRDLAKSGTVTINESPQSAKNYVSIEDVVEILPRIAMEGKDRLYNIASEQNTTHADLAVALRESGYKIEFSLGVAARILPPISIERVIREFNFKPRSLIKDLPNLIRKEIHD